MNDQESLLSADRRAAIVRRLEKTGSVRVHDLVDEFGVSAPTIRRDLSWIEEQGLAQRVHGGAVAVDKPALPGAAPEAIPARIGQAAAGLVEDGETIFIGAGRLGLELARALAKRGHLTVITNGLQIAHQIAADSHHTLIVTGGQLERQNYGLLASAAPRELRADRVFVQLGGVSAVDGLTDDDLPQTEMVRQLLELGAQTTVMVDPRRVGRVAAAYIAPASEIDVIITTREADSAPLWDLSELGVRVVLA